VKGSKEGLRSTYYNARNRFTHTTTYRLHALNQNLR